MFSITKLIQNRRDYGKFEYSDEQGQSKKGTPIPLTTRSDSYYDFKIDPLDDKGEVRINLGFFFHREGRRK
ncbi:MAG: hypothetical protein K6E19_10530 [Lachnospiraceae bacterium]|nr:hypothetical protein [Lachnospiraceae bacterium]